MFSQQNRSHAILIASRMRGRKLPQLVPIAALVQLAIPYRKVAKSVQWRTIRLALYRLSSADQSCTPCKRKGGSGAKR